MRILLLLICKKSGLNGIVLYYENKNLTLPVQLQNYLEVSANMVPTMRFLISLFYSVPPTSED